MSISSSDSQQDKNVQLFLYISLIPITYEQNLIINGYKIGSCRLLGALEAVEGVCWITYWQKYERECCRHMIVFVRLKTALPVILIILLSFISSLLVCFFFFFCYLKNRKRIKTTNLHREITCRSVWQTPWFVVVGHLAEFIIIFYHFFCLCTSRLH